MNTNRQVIPSTTPASQARIVYVNALVQAILSNYPKTSADEARAIILKLIERFGFKPLWE